MIKQVGQISAPGESGTRVYTSALYDSCNFAINLKVQENTRLPNKSNPEFSGVNFQQKL